MNKLLATVARTSTKSLRRPNVSILSRPLSSSSTTTPIGDNAWSAKALGDDRNKSSNSLEFFSSVQYFQNTEKYPEHVRKLAVEVMGLSIVECHQLMHLMQVITAIVYIVVAIVVLILIMKVILIIIMIVIMIVIGLNHVQ